MYLLHHCCVVDVSFFIQLTFSENQAVADIALTVLADNIPEPAEKVIIILTDVTTVGLADVSKGAYIDLNRSMAEIDILPNVVSYGVIGWHLDSEYILTQEPQGKQALKPTLIPAWKKCLSNPR